MSRRLRKHKREGEEGSKFYMYKLVQMEGQTARG